MATIAGNTGDEGLTLSTQTPLTRELAIQLRQRFGTPLFVYDESVLLRQARSLLDFPHAYGLTVRYAIKANPLAALLRLLDRAGLHMDASSSGEAQRAIRAEIAADRISLSSQQLDPEFADLVDAGVSFVATSIHQLQRYGETFPGKLVAVRFNPGMGSGKKGKTNVGGPDASFGIWHEQAAEVESLLAQHRLQLTRIHTHIGSGVDPEVWKRVAELSLQWVARFADVTTLDLGGGFRVARMADEPETDLQSIGRGVQASFEKFAASTGRRIQLEIEPGTWVVAQAGSLLATVQDIVATGATGHRFLRLDTGMTEILRPSMYGAQHPMRLIQVNQADSTEQAYVIVGHCCESGDVLTTAQDDPTTIADRKFPTARIGDMLEIGGAGAYCSAMSAVHYNSYPSAAEVLLPSDGGEPQLIRRRGTLADMTSCEIA